MGTACELGGLPIPEFQEAFCSRCTQPECTRSLTSTSKFDQRVQNWEERLFIKVPRMSKDDPRYEPIVTMGQKFQTLETSQSSEWVDPNQMERKPMIVVPGNVSRTTSSPAGGKNTPFQNGTMLGGKEPPTQKPALDPWAVPPKDGEKASKPGVRVRLGNK